MINSEDWQKINTSLCAKIISELHYEERLHPTDKGDYWQLKTPHRNWEFKAKVTIWGMLEIEPYSITCSDNLAPQACQLLLDTREMLKISDINLANLLEEIQQTLYSDTVRLTKLQGVTASDLVSMDETERQRYIDAHPKAIANKGRLGWGKHR